MAATDRRLHWMNVIFPEAIDFPGNTDGIIAPSGLTAERPTSPTKGTIRYNTSNNTLEAFIINAWEVIGSGGSGGITTFTGLSDTPGSYPIGTPLLRVNIGQTGIEFVDGSTLFLPLAGGTMNAGQSITLAGGTVKGLPSPQFGSDAANKEYVDGIAAGLAAKESVHSASTANINLATQGLNGIDGHANYLDGDRVLVKDQTNPVENGIYAAHVGPWTRTLDMDGTPANEVQGGTTTYVQHGTVNGNTNWVVVNTGNVNVDTDPMNWSLISSGGTQNLWETISGDGGSAPATSPVDTLTIAGGTGISTAMAGSTLTITNDLPNVVQDTFKTITGDTGIVVASGDANTLAIVGDGSTISTAMTTGPDKITISVLSSPPPTRIEDGVDNDSFVDTSFGGANSETVRIQSGTTLSNGGPIQIEAGPAVSGSAATGGSINITSGNGPAYTGQYAGGYAGNINITGGTGGKGTGPGGNGGTVTIEGGVGGDAGLSSNSGDVIIRPGAPATFGGSAGVLKLGLADLQFPNTDGANGEVLTTDGSGNLSFAAAGGGTPFRIENASTNAFVETGYSGGATVDIEMQAESTSGGAGDAGVINIRGGSATGAGTSDTGGGIVLYGGDSNTGGDAGSISLYAGKGTGGSTRGGTINIIAGYAGSTNYSGNINITGGDGSVNGAYAGDVTITSGASSYTQAGYLELFGGNSSNKDGGTIKIFGGNNAAGGYYGGDVLIKGGAGSSGTGVVKLGAAQLTYPDTDGANGEVLTTNGAGVLSFAAPVAPIPGRIQDGDNNTFVDTSFGAGSDTNNLRLETGANPGYNGGDIDIVSSAGTEYGYNGGVINITSGDGAYGGGGVSAGAGGDINITAGSSTAGYNQGAGGNIKIIAGNSDGTGFAPTGGGGDIEITAGTTGNTNNFNGTIRISGGDNTYLSGTAGGVRIFGGDGLSAGIGGNVELEGGQGSNGGDVRLTAASGADQNGNVILKPGNNISGTLGYVSLGTANLKFPNTDGSAGSLLTTDGLTNLSFGNVPVAPSYTLATLPAFQAGGFIYVSDATGGGALTGSLCFSNGTVWIDTTTGIAVV